MEYATLSAIELQREIDNAEDYAEDSGPELWNALKEIQRLRTICQDVLETIATDSAFIYENCDIWDGVRKLQDIAGAYYVVPNQSPTLEKL